MYESPHTTASNLSKRYAGRTVLDNVSFKVGPGEIVGLLGPNGAGKTTLIGSLLGLLLPDEGRAMLFGKPSSDLGSDLRGRVGFVPQHLSGFDWFRVGELIDYLAAFQSTTHRAMPQELLDWAALDMSARVKRLSGGERQRLAIMLGMRHSPDLLILDEPVASLDPRARQGFIAMLARYCAGGRAALISSHILSDIEKVATRAIFLRAGRVVYDAEMDVFRRYTRWVDVSRSELPVGTAVLIEDNGVGRVLVEHWTDEAHRALCAQLGREVKVSAPDLEAAFLEMTR